MKTRRTIIVSGMIAGHPWQGGATWAVLQYVLGFARLGHDVYLVEPISAATVQPAGAALEDSQNARYFFSVACEFGLVANSALLLAETHQAMGLPYERLQEIARRTDVLINISGMLTDESLLASIPVRVYLDLDPAFNQLWSSVEGIDMGYEAHTHFVTIGRCIGQPRCSVPSCGLTWSKTFQPVVLDHWPESKQIQYDALTTIANWRGYGSIQHDGIMYGQKAHSLRQFYSLPETVTEKFMLALAIHPNETRDLLALAVNGWHLLDPALVANTPAACRSFIQGSKAEFGIAKSGYVLSRCGWFSDRSICYLASGRPVIAQETGFSDHLPTGEGLFAFSTARDVQAAIEHLHADYPRHCAGARAIAAEYFESDKVLTRLLEMVGC